MIKPYSGENALKRKKTGAICLNSHCDLSYWAFKLAWNHVIKKLEKLVFPKDLICGLIDPDLCRIINLILEGNILIVNTGDIDEWWVTFVDADGNDIDVMFYSPGA